jgi:hypothetical protein
MIATGSVTLRRCMIKEHDESLGNAWISSYVFKPINDDRSEKASIGFCDPMDPVNLDFTRDFYFEKDVDHIGVRVDKKNPSSIVLKSMIKEKMADFKKEKGIEKISRQQRLLIKEECLIQVLKDTSATVKVYDMVHDKSNKTLYIGASGRAGENLLDLIEASQNTYVTPLYPGIMASRIAGVLGDIGLDGNTSKMDILQRTASWGSEFLTWLLVRFRNERFHKDFSFEFEGSISFASDGKKLKIESDACGNEEEAKDQLEKKSIVKTAKIIFVSHDGDEWKFTIDDNFDIKGMKLPVPKMIDHFEYMRLRLDSINKFYTYFDAIFEEFVSLRRDEINWKEEMKSWEF